MHAAADPVKRQFAGAAGVASLCWRWVVIGKDIYGGEIDSQYRAYL